mgnify:CR=1 FL=1
MRMLQIICKCDCMIGQFMQLLRPYIVLHTQLLVITSADVMYTIAVS